MPAAPSPLRLAADPEAAPSGVRASVRVRTAAQLLDCDEMYIRRCLTAKTLEGHRLGKRGVRVYVDSIIDHQEAGLIGGTKGQPPHPRPSSRTGAAHREAMAALHSLGIL